MLSERDTADYESYLTEQIEIGEIKDEKVLVSRMFGF